MPMSLEESMEYLTLCEETGTRPMPSVVERVRQMRGGRGSQSSDHQDSSRHGRGRQQSSYSGRHSQDSSPEPMPRSGRTQRIQINEDHPSSRRRSPSPEPMRRGRHGDRDAGYSNRDAAPRRKTRLPASGDPFVDLCNNIINEPSHDEYDAPSSRRGAGGSRRGPPSPTYGRPQYDLNDIEMLRSLSPADFIAAVNADFYSEDAAPVGPRYVEREPGYIEREVPDRHRGGSRYGSDRDDRRRYR